MMIELGNDDMRQRGERRPAACDRLDWRGRRDDPLARAAAILGTQGADHAPAHWHDIELLVGILTEQAQRPSAIGAGATAPDRLMHHLFAGQMGGQ